MNDAGHETVAVFSARGRPGQAQARQLRRAGYRVQAIKRSKLFRVDMRPVLERIPIRLTPMREWLRRRDWPAEQREFVGSVSG